MDHKDYTACGLRVLERHRMEHLNRSAIAAYLSYAIQSTGQAIAWQFVTHFVKHGLQVDSFLILTLVWSAPAFVTMGAVSLWGSVSDRVGRRKPFMVLGFVGYSSTFFFYSFVTDVAQFLVIAMAGAAFSASAIPAGQAYLTARTEKKGERLGFFLVVQSGGWFFGALASGLLYNIVGMLTLFRVSAALCMAATALSFFVVRDLPVDKTVVRPKVSFWELIGRPGMARLALAASVSAIGIYAVSYGVAIIIIDELHGDAAYVGYANSGATLIAALITGYVGRLIDRHGSTPILAAAYLSYCLYAVGFAIATDPMVATIFYMLPIYALAQTGAQAFAARVSSDEERGTAMGIVNAAQNAGNAIGPIVGGLFAQFVFAGLLQPVSWVTLSLNLVALMLAYSLFNIEKQARRKKDSFPSPEAPAQPSVNVDEPVP